MIIRHTVMTVMAMVLLPLFAVVGQLTIWMADREEPVQLQAVTVDPQAVKPCGEIQIRVKRFGIKHTGVKVERYLRDATHERFSLETSEYDDNPGPLGLYEYYTTFRVPCSFDPGWAYYHGATSYFRNPIQRYLWPIPGGERDIRFCIFTDALAPEQACKKDDHALRGKPALASSTLPLP